MSRGEKSLWDLAIDQENVAEGEKAIEEASVLVLGSKNSGKTSIILRFLDRDEAPKPTVALEYTFGRRSKGHNLAKDVAHIWELGGGTWLSKLVDIPVNMDTVKHISIVIVLDLSKPQELWVTAEKLIAVAKQRVNDAIAEARSIDPAIKETLKTKAFERLGNDHPDKDMVDPFPIPLVFIGGKYDVFQDFDSEQRKVICKTLRFIAHTHGAHLQFFSAKQEGLLNRARGMLSHLAFGTPPGKTIQLEHNKPLVIPAGQDSLQAIGSPPLADGDLGRVTARSPMELWKTAFTSIFPQENISDPAQVEDPAKDVQYKEAAVDAMRAQKDEELERYRRLCERRAKEAHQLAMAGVQP